MPKKQRIIPAASKAVATPTPIAFPDIAHKQCLDVTVLVEDQILLIDVRNLTGLTYISLTCIHKERS
jgi:hypothetical protein